MTITTTASTAHLPIIPTALTSTQPASVAAPKATTKPQETLLTFTHANGSTGKVRVNVNMMGPGDIMLAVKGIIPDATLDRHGNLVLPSESSVTGDAATKTILGLP